jgi:hypothetical protein
MRSDERGSKYVNTGKDSVKRGDQNTAIIGPARLSAEEESEQTVDRGVSAANIINIPASASTKLGRFAPGYWYQPDGTGSAVNNAFPHSSGYAIPFMVYEASIIDAIGMVVSDGTAGGVTGPGDYYRTRIGIYSEVEGIPTNLVVQTAQFSYGDGTIPNGTLYKDTSIAATVLIPGRYWLVFRRSSNANLANPAYPRFRDGFTSGTVLKGPFTEANTIVTATPQSIGYSMDFVAGSTGPGVDFSMDPVLDFWTYVVNPTRYVPDMWVRGA